MGEEAGDLNVVGEQGHICVVFEEGLDEIGVLPVVIFMFLLLYFLYYLFVVFYVLEVVVNRLQFLLCYFVPGFNYFNGLCDTQIEGQYLLVLLNEGWDEEVVALEGKGP